jgi:hypothetical protein
MGAAIARQQSGGDPASAACASLVFAAIVQPTSHVAKVPDNGIDLRFFSTVEKAAEWLTSPRVVD